MEANFGTPQCETRVCGPQMRPAHRPGGLRQAKMGAGADFFKRMVSDEYRYRLAAEGR